MGNITSRENTCDTICQQYRQQTAPGIYETKEATFLRLFNPSREYDYAADPEKAFNGMSPTLDEVEKSIGEQTLHAYVFSLLMDLSYFIGIQKIVNDQVEAIAKLIIAKHKHMRVAELMTFMYELKMGSYGQFYGRLDGQQILGALRQFVLQRVGDQTCKANEKKRQEAEKRGDGQDITAAEYAAWSRANGHEPHPTIVRAADELTNITGSIARRYGK